MMNLTKLVCVTFGAIAVIAASGAVPDRMYVHIPLSNTDSFCITRNGGPMDIEVGEHRIALKEEQSWQRSHEPKGQDIYGKIIDGTCCTPKTSYGGWLKDEWWYLTPSVPIKQVGMEFNFRWTDEDGNPSTDVEADIKKFLAKTHAPKKVEVEVVVGGETYDMTYAEWKERMTMALPHITSVVQRSRQ